jgi:transglutaminase-like putative cysteine protease
MRIRAGYEITYECPAPTPMMLLLSVRPERRADLVTPDALHTRPDTAVRQYRDGFGNLCTRVLAPEGRITFSSDFLIRDSGAPDGVFPDAMQAPVDELPDDVLVYLLGSRYCETQQLNDLAWKLFGDTPTGWARVQAILDFVHNHIRFDYMQADRYRGAYDAYLGQVGVCRDYTHLAVAFCRCMNIPARYCTGYLGDINNVPVPGPMDFSAWFEVYLGGHWYTADARNNTPRTGRILMAIGRDATDVAISTEFGPSLLSEFLVVTEEVPTPAERRAGNAEA